MDKATFLQLEYESLRKEIEQIHDRIFRLLVGGSTIVPAAQLLLTFASKQAGGQLSNLLPSDPVSQVIGSVLLLLPFVVFITVLIYLGQNLHMMRCGRYIKDYIEPAVPDVLGWETWMERNPRQFRSPDKYVRNSFYMLSGVYYIASTFLAVRFTRNLSLDIPFYGKISGAMFSTFMFWVYAITACWALMLLIGKAKASHSTSTHFGLLRGGRPQPIRDSLDRFLAVWQRQEDEHPYLTGETGVCSESVAVDVSMGTDVAPTADADTAAQGSDNAGSRHVFDEFRQAFPGMTVSLEEILAEGDRVVFRWIGEGKQLAPFFGIPATNRTVRVSGVWNQRIVDGKVVDAWGEVDTLDLLQQFGTVPTGSRHPQGFLRWIRLPLEKVSLVMRKLPTRP